MGEPACPGGHPGSAGSAAEWERLFISEQPTIKSIIGHIARRYRLSADEIDELTSDVAVKLIEDDYAVLRKFQKRSSLRTYLSVVIQRVQLDSRVARWGKSRPSARARRLGPDAVLFEQLVVRAGLSFDAACAAVESTVGRPIDRRALEPLAARRPLQRRWTVPLEDVEAVLTAAVPDDADRADSERSMALLSRELQALSPVDRVLVRRRFFEHASIASIARETAQDQKMLYRRMARVLARLRERLEDQGVSVGTVISTRP